MPDWSLLFSRLQMLIMPEEPLEARMADQLMQLKIDWGKNGKAQNKKKDRVF